MAFKFTEVVLEGDFTTHANRTYFMRENMKS